jgi:hypothetical protein
MTCSAACALTTLLIACYILYEVSTRVKVGIQEGAKEGTVVILHAARRRVSERLAPGRFHEIFTRPDSQTQTVTALRSDCRAETLGDAIGAYLASIERPERRGQHKQYAATLRRFSQALGADADLAGLSAAAVRAWSEQTWGDRKAATYNLAIDVFRSAWAYWIRLGWAGAHPTAPMRRLKVAPDRSRACPAPTSASCSTAMTSRCAARRCGAWPMSWPPHRREPPLTSNP